MMRFQKSICLLVLLTGLTFSVWAKKGLPMAFVEQNCMDCHDADQAESGLNFEALSTDLDDQDSLRHWIQVFDRV